MRRFLRLVQFAAILCIGCVPDAPTEHGAWSGVVDTLAGGGIRVHSAAPVWGDDDGWRLVEDVRIGTATGEGPSSFGAVADVASDASGRIYVLDGMAQELRIFDADGVHLWTAGGEGEGPGEFTRVVGIGLAPDGSVWVMDSRNRRYTRFDGSGTLLSDSPRPLAGPFSVWAGGFTADGRLLEQGQVERGPRSTGPGVMLLDADLAPGASLAVPPFDVPVLGSSQGQGFRFSQPVPFAPSQIWAPDLATPGMWLGTTHPYSFARLTLTGDTLLVVQRPADLLPLTAEDHAEIEARIASLVDQGIEPDRSALVDRKPVARWLEAAPDGHLWVRVWPEDASEGSVYDVFDPAGRYLGQVRTDVDFERGLFIAEDAVVGVTTDAFDVPYVVRMRLVPAGGT